MVKVLYGELKWGFIPVKRIVEDYPEDIVKTVETDESSEYSNVEKKELDQQTSSAASAPVAEKSGAETTETGEGANIIEYEYRDEAERKWWKFFDEQEYTIPAHIKNKKRQWNWFEPNTNGAEKKLLVKLDILLAFYSCMAYWVKYLDTVNLNNAFVSGMQESLNMTKNDLTNTQNMFSIGNTIFQIPFLFVLFKCPLNYTLPILDIVWSLFTVGACKSQTLGQLQACRFFVGAAEAPAYFAYQYLFGSFYQSTELVRRSTFYYFGQYIGVLSSGALQGALYKYGTATFEGWRVAFLVDAMISLGVGFLGFYMIPGNDPYNIYSLFLSDDEIRLLRKRTKRNVFKASDNLLDWKVWLRLFSQPKIYVLSLFNAFLWCCSNASSGSYLLWLQSLKEYSVVKLNQLSMTSAGIGLVLLAVFGLYADLFNSKYQAIILSQCVNFTGNVILSCYSRASKGAKYFAFNIAYSAWAAAPTGYMYMAIMSRDSEERSKILVVANIFAQTMSIIGNKFAFNAKDAPSYKHGFPFAAAMAVCLSLCSLVVLFMYKRQERALAKSNGIILYNSKTGENYPLDKEEA
ncbi:hypothetical protein ACO0QE_003443 [Hanseniaspora vineae]